MRISNLFLFGMFSAIVMLVSNRCCAQNITTFAGNGAYGTTGDGGAANMAELAYPSGVALSKRGNIYIADQGGQCIRKVNRAGIITTVAGNGIGGYSSDSIAATASQLNYPEGVAVDKYENIYIADQYNNRIRKVDTQGIITTIAGNGTLGYSGDGAAATNAELYGPADVGVDSNGNVYFADANNHAVREVEAATGLIKTVAGTGAYGYSGDGGPGTAAKLFYPCGIAVDANNQVYIADQYNNRIRKLTLGIISTVAGDSTGGYNGDGGPATHASLTHPTAVTVSANGDIFICDEANFRIRKVTASTGVISTVAGGGTVSPDTCGPATAAALNAIQGIAVDTGERFYIADFNHSRVLKISDTSCVPPNHTGVPNVSQGDVQIYPNPASGNFYIATAATVTRFPIKIYNMVGDEIYSSLLDGPLSVISVENYPNGLYTIYVNIDNVQIVKKISVLH